MREQDLPANATARGEQLVTYLRQELEQVDAVTDIRNLGLLVGISLDRSCAELVRIALDNRLLINVTAGNVIRLLPPLIINEQQTIDLAERLLRSIKQFIQD